MNEMFYQLVYYSAPRNACLKVDGLDPELVDDEGEEVDAQESNHQTQHQAPHQEPHLPHSQCNQSDGEYK